MRRSLPVLLLSSAVSSGCGLVAAPCRISSALIKIVPVVGHPAAVPTDACAEFIDPTPAFLEDAGDADD